MQKAFQLEKLSSFAHKLFSLKKTQGKTKTFLGMTFLGQIQG